MMSLETLDVASTGNILSSGQMELKPLIQPKMSRTVHLAYLHHIGVESALATLDSVVEIRKLPKLINNLSRNDKIE